MNPPPAAAPSQVISPQSIAAMLLLALLWGLSIPVTKLGLETMPPMLLTALRYAIAVPLFLVLLPGRGRLPRSALPQVALLGILGIGIGQVSQTLGIIGTSASTGTVISAMIPVFVVIFAAWRLRQRVTGWQRLGIALAFAGIAAVAMGQGGEGAARTTLQGAVLVLLSAVTISLYYVWSIEIAARHGTVAVVVWSTMAGFIAMLPWAVAEARRVPFDLTVEAFAAAAYLGLVVTVAGLFLWLWILRTVPARIAASVQFLQPLVGIAASALAFGDPMGPMFLLGGALVLAGVGLTVMRGP